MHNLSAKTEYACLAILELAMREESGDPVCLRAIANAHSIPSQFLAQIFQQLRSADLVRSIRGAGGGYRLTRPARDITVADVVLAIDGPKGSRALDSRSESAVSGVLVDAWRTIAQAQREVLDATNFGELAARARSQTSDMYYI